MRSVGPIMFPCNIHETAMTSCISMHTETMRLIFCQILPIEYVAGFVVTGEEGVQDCVFSGAGEGVVIMVAAEHIVPLV